MPAWEYTLPLSMHTLRDNEWAWGWIKLHWTASQSWRVGSRQVDTFSWIKSQGHNFKNVKDFWKKKKKTETHSMYPLTSHDDLNKRQLSDQKTPHVSHEKLFLSLSPFVFYCSQFLFLCRSCSQPGRVEDGGCLERTKCADERHARPSHTRDLFWRRHRSLVKYHSNGDWEVCPLCVTQWTRPLCLCAY